MIEIYNQPLIQGGLALSTILLPVVGMALSQRMRERALDLAGHQCQREGEHEGGLEAAHIDHRKEEVNGIPYDDPRRVEILCTRHHLFSHLENEGKNGLHLKANRWAIQKLRERLGLEP